MERVIASSIALIVVVSIHSGLEEKIADFFQDQEWSHAKLVTFAITISIGIISLLILEYISTSMYNSSAFLRMCLYMIHREPYFEGWWVDVGVDDSAGIPEVLSYSFITILYNKGALEVEGLSWETRRPDWRHHWDSIYSIQNEADLYFEYQYTSGDKGLPTPAHETAHYRFMRDNNNFEGKYDDDKFISHGALNKVNKKLFGSQYKFPTLEQREQYARMYMNYYINKHGFDPHTFRRRGVSQSKARREDSFIRFVRQSNSKTAEVELLVNTLRSIEWFTPIRSILDLGAGEGTLTIPALEALTFSSTGKYVAVDSNGILLEALSTRLQRDAGRNEDKNTVLLRRAIDDFILYDTDNFDLVLACHCLYFVDNISEIISAIFDQKLQKGGRFVSMHTDIMSERATFNRRLAEKFNKRLQLTTIQEVDALAAKKGMSLLHKREADVILKFPPLDRNGWKMVIENGEGDNVVKTIELISFIVDRGPGEFGDEWEDCVSMVRSYLACNRNEMVFPEIAHVFEKQ
jgi:SAM-dependent methyltransferase